MVQKRVGHIMVKKYRIGPINKQCPHTAEFEKGDGMGKCYLLSPMKLHAENPVTNGLHIPAVILTERQQRVQGYMG